MFKPHYENNLPPQLILLGENMQSHGEEFPMCKQKYHQQFICKSSTFSCQKVVSEIALLACWRRLRKSTTAWYSNMRIQKNFISQSSPSYFWLNSNSEANDFFLCWFFCFTYRLFVLHCKNINNKTMTFHSGNMLVT